MKALHLHLEEDKKKPKHMGENYAVMEKYDGWFMYNDCIDGEWQGIRSKTGRVLPSMAKYSKLFTELDYPTINLRLIFEAVIPQDGSPRGYMVFEDCNGKFNQQKYTLQNVHLKVHDVLLEGRNPAFGNRWNTLYKLFQRWTRTDAVEWLHQVQILDRSSHKEDWMNQYNYIIENKGEGIILKRIEGRYEAGKRNFNLMKIKCELTLDLLVVGIVEGKGKYAGTLGNLVVKDKNGVLNNISGMSDQQRMLWYATPSLIVNQIVEAKAMKRYPDGRLREGRFKAVRHDKNIGDID